MLEPIVEHWIVMAYRPQVAFEVLHVDGIEADQGCIQADVQFSQLFAKYEWTAIIGYDFLQFVQ